jgi:hypothetical protein
MLHRLSHNLTSYSLPNTFDFRTDEPSADQSIIIDRLINYYSYMKLESKRRNVHSISGIWAYYIDLFKEFDEALDSRDGEIVSKTLLKICTTKLVIGFASYYSYAAIAHDLHAAEFESYLTIDRVLSLAESLGAAHPQCPFQGPSGYFELDLDALFDGIKRRVPFDISPPKAGGGAFGLRTPEGIISISEILAIHAAARADTFLLDTPQKTVCEIGGGLGTLAFYMSKTCAESVTVADLPIVSIIQGYYLMKSLGPNAVRLAAETGSGKVNIIPYWELDHIPEKSISMFINIDSMPEIDANIAEHYIKLINRKGSDFFFSINQETNVNNQNIVQNLIEKSGGFRRINRTPHWMIRGYVEELYKIQKNEELTRQSTLSSFPWRLGRGGS